VRQKRIGLPATRLRAYQPLEQSGRQPPGESGWRTAPPSSLWYRLRQS
jgi:hypothetical protein